MCIKWLIMDKFIWKQTVPAAATCSTHGVAWATLVLGLLKLAICCQPGLNQTELSKTNIYL